MPDVRQNKGGRPPKPAECSMSEEIRTWLPPQYADMVHREALRHGYTTAEYVRLKLGFPAYETDYLEN